MTRRFHTAISAIALLGVAACVRVKSEVISSLDGSVADLRSGSGGAPVGGGAGGAPGSGGDAGIAQPIPNPKRSCKVPPDDLNGKLKECTRRAPPKAFEPKLKWSWSEPDDPKAVARGSTIIPLVANLTDDNGDGAIDLCDVPDIIVTVFRSYPVGSQVFVLAGDTGKMQFQLEGYVAPDMTPAVGDIDGDGVPEIVAMSMDETRPVIYDNKGRIKLTGEQATSVMAFGSQNCGAISIYDLDADGKPEIVVSALDVFNSQGRRLFGHIYPASVYCMTDAAADLDGDGKLEVILGNAAFHADGRMAFRIPGSLGQPHVANFDDDPEPEILVTSEDGVVVLEANGTVKFGPVRLTTARNESPRSYAKPAAVHDFDGDGRADLAISSWYEYQILSVTGTGLSMRWRYPIHDPSGIASSTGFDFLGRGSAEPIYADEQDLHVLDGRSGALAFKLARTSGTIIEYPVVADVDADDSADILLVSREPHTALSTPRVYATLQVFEDAQKRWIPARRIWNQHSYFVANVREDGTIPKVMPRHWLRNNTFRANAQVEGLGDCAPIVVE